MKNIAIIGASGAIGSGFIDQYSQRENVGKIYAFSRSGDDFDSHNVISIKLDLTDEKSISSAVDEIPQDLKLDVIIVATGILHEGEMKPEKSFKEITAENFHRVLAVNTIGPALVIKHFAPRMCKDKTSVFALLSARVGSISDNSLGGWHSYRASKAALNMIIKNASIEIARTNKEACIIGLHPGTTDSNLSKPFQAFVKEGKLFTPQFATEKMAEVIDNATAAATGKCFAYDGQEIPA